MLSQDYPVALACELLDCPRSSYYHQPEQPDDTELEVAIQAVVAEWPTYGYRRVAAQLRRQEWTVNHIYLAVIMDVFARGIRGWHLDVFARGIRGWHLDVVWTIH